jgi:DNA-binding NtrC family response regulator
MSEPAAPKPSADREEVQQDSTDTAQNALAGSILIVHFDSGTRKSLQNALEAAGYHVEGCEDGEQALNALAERPYVLVITAIEMPRIDGLELVRTIRQRLPDMPVIAVSDGRKISQVYLRGAVALGAASSHSLPESHGTLLEVVRSTLASSSAGPG